MTRTIKQSGNWKLIQDSYHKCTCLINKETGKQSNWNTGSDAKEEIVHCIGLTDIEFINYCKDVCNVNV